MREKKAANKEPSSMSPHQRIEPILRTTRTALTDMPTEDIQGLVHQLQVHHAELQIENEAQRQAQIELAESRDRYYELYEFAPIGYIKLDRAGTILQANLAAAILLEVDRRKLRGLRLTDFVDAQSQDAWHRHRQAVFSSGQKQTCELPLNKRSGGLRWARLESQAVPGQQEASPQCFSALIDMTESKRAEQQLLQLQGELERCVAERTSALAMLNDIATMASKPADVEEAILYALQRVSEHNGWNCSHAWLPANNDPHTLLASYAWYDHAPPHFVRLREKVLAIRLRPGEGLVGRVFATGEPEFTTDISEYLPVSEPSLAEHEGVQTAAAFPVLTENEVVGVLEFFSEKQIESIEQMREAMASVGKLLGHVVEREQAKTVLRMSKDHLRAILDAAPDAIFSVDCHGTITRVNPAAEKIFGYTAHEMLGRNLAMLMTAPYRVGHDGCIDRYLRNREPHLIGLRREVQGFDKSGRTLPIELAVNEIEHSGLFVGVIRDISRRKKLEKEVVEAAADEQRRIGEDIHDGLGQELTGLRYMAQTHAESLAQKSLPDAQTAWRMSEWLKTVQQQLRAIIRELIPVEVDQFGLAAALRGLAERTAEVHDPKCELECLQPILVPDALLATHLYRIAQEAVRNAVRHAQANRIVIRLSHDEDTLRLQVSDDGIGIGASPEEYTGFGLRSMAHRAGLIGAKLDVWSGEGGGTRVTCTVSRGLANAWAVNSNEAP